MELKLKEFRATEIKKLEINCKIFQICVTNSLSENIEISWRDTTLRTLKVKQDGDNLVITDKAMVTVYGTLALINLKKDSQLVVKIPNAFTGKIILQSNEEKIHLTDITSLGDIGISSNTGEVLLENVYANLIDVRGNHGKVECYSVAVDSMLDISTKDGQITCYIDGSKDDYSIFCNTKSHKCTCPETNDESPKKVRVVSQIGSISIDFQSGNLARKSTNRYDRHNSFKDW